MSVKARPYLGCCVVEYATPEEADLALAVVNSDPEAKLKAYRATLLNFLW